MDISNQKQRYYRYIKKISDFYIIVHVYTSIYHVISQGKHMKEVLNDKKYNIY